MLCRDKGDGVAEEREREGGRRSIETRATPTVTLVDGTGRHAVVMGPRGC